MTPIIIFGFNRAESLCRTVESLLGNEEAAESDLFVFVDGPRKGKAGETEKVNEVRKYAEGIRGFKSLTCTFAERNKGLAPSIISGVTQVMNKYGRAIVVEDDLVVAPNFLSFMNQALDRYEGDANVFSVCGYTNRVKPPKGYAYNAYFCVRSSSWGWATWKDRWASVDWELKDWAKHARNAKAFNKWGGSDCFKMLNDWHEGRNQSWAIRFCYAQFLQGKAALFPLTSKLDNRGFDGEGTNCKRWSRFKFDLDTSGLKQFRFPDRAAIDPTLRKAALAYHSIPIRIWSKLMYLIH